LAEKGILFVGSGVSGGEEGARYGPSLMPGGNPKAWPHIKPIFQAIAAKAPDGAPCCDWVGENGAGHYVKMVHNGIGKKLPSTTALPFSPHFFFLGGGRIW
jgi:6-phosphogluconate dehydrogenase